MNDASNDSFTLSEALERHKIELPDAQVAQISRYCDLLWNRNRKLNLTRHTTYDLFVGRDVADSWQLAQLLEPGEEVLDIGSGGGVPGLLLALLRPDVEVSVCDSVGKKSIALGQFVDKLGLAVPVYGDRAETILEDLRFTSVTARAVGPLWKMLRSLNDHWDAMGRLLLVKGPRWLDERGEARHRGLLQDLDLRREISYPIPDSSSESVILSVSRSIKTSA